MPYSLRKNHNHAFPSSKYNNSFLFFNPEILCTFCCKTACTSENETYTDTCRHDISMNITDGITDLWGLSWFGCHLLRAHIVLSFATVSLLLARTWVVLPVCFSHEGIYFVVPGFYKGKSYHPVSSVFLWIYVLGSFRTSDRRGVNALERDHCRQCRFGSSPFTSLYTKSISPLIKN